MEAYATPAFFAIAALVSVPALVLGFLERPLRLWALVATGIMTAAVVWADPPEGIRLVAVVAFSLALVRGHLAWRTRHPRGRWEPPVAVALALAPLVAIKLAAPLQGPTLGFVGASYLAFRVVQIVVETSDGLITQLGWVDTLIDLLFFPTLSSGPIDRSRRMTVDLHARLTRAEYSELVRVGTTRFVLGFGYKYVGAVTCSAALKVLPNAAVVPVMYAYTGQLFFDFAGYSLMAVGLSMVFGVRTPMNFRLPFVAESIRDFWTRWHISLSFWLRDYVYHRLVRTLARARVGTLTAHRIGLMTNMVLMGAWHGLSPNYLVYGAYHGVLLVGNDVWERSSPVHRRYHQATWYRICAVAITAHLTMFGFLIFSGRLI